jgi:hypothetical protein
MKYSNFGPSRQFSLRAATLLNLSNILSRFSMVLVPTSVASLSRLKRTLKKYKSEIDNEVEHASHSGAS